MIARDEYDRIQELLGRKSNPRLRTYAFAFTGMIRCEECGCLITAENKTKHQKNGIIRHYTYYHCTKRKGVCSQKTIRDNELEEQIKSELEAVVIPPEFREWAMEVIQDENKKEFTDKISLFSSQQKAYIACLEEFDGLVSMRAKGHIDEETFLRKKSTLEQEKSRLKGLMGESDQSVDDWLERAEQLFHFAEIGKSRFDSGTIMEKKEILSFLGSNLLLKDQKLRITKKNELIAMEELAKEEKAIRTRFEPLDLPLDKAKLRAKYAQSPTMLQGLDAIRTFFRHSVGSCIL